jgi:hypothetical protein
VHANWLGRYPYVIYYRIVAEEVGLSIFGMWRVSLGTGINRVLEWLRPIVRAIR